MMDWITRDRLRTGFRLGVVAGATLFLAACEVSEASGSGPGPGGSGGGYCPRIYDPVCASSGRSERTFPNSCEARASGWFVEYRGECRRAGWDRDRGRDGWDRDRGRDRDGWDRDRGRDRDGWDRDRGRDRDRDGRDRDRPSDPRTPPPSTPLPPPLPPAPPTPPPDAGACPQVFDPVCGQVGTQTQRFPNECEMVRAGGSRVADGLCMGGGN